MLLGTLLPAAATAGGTGARALFVQDAGAAVPNLVIKSALLDGTELHMWMDVVSPQGRMQSGLAPLALVLGEGTHSVTASDYGRFTFDHWEDGSRSRTRDVNIGGSLVVLTAYYRSPSITLSPSSGTTGSSAAVRGANFAPDSQVAITYDGAQVATAPADGAGRWRRPVLGVL